MHQCKFGQNPPIGPEDKSAGKADFYNLYMMVDLELGQDLQNLIYSNKKETSDFHGTVSSIQLRCHCKK